MHSSSKAALQCDYCSQICGRHFLRASSSYSCAQAPLASFISGMVKAITPRKVNEDQTHEGPGIPREVPGEVPAEVQGTRLVVACCSLGRR